MPSLSYFFFQFCANKGVEQSKEEKALKVFTSNPREEENWKQV